MELVAEGVEARSRLAARDRSEPFPKGIDLTGCGASKLGSSHSLIREKGSQDEQRVLTL